MQQGMPQTLQQIGTLASQPQQRQGLGERRQYHQWLQVGRTLQLLELLGKP
jgi:hypothetical protein